MEDSIDARAFKILAEYNRHANSEMNGIIRNLQPDQWNQEFRGFYNSIKALCNHIYLADFFWLKRFSRLRRFSYIGDELFTQELRFGMIVFETIGEYLEKRQAIDAQFVAFVSEVTQKDLDEYLEFTDSRGQGRRGLFGGLVLHCFNHQTHHRGMISIYLEYMGVLPTITVIWQTS